MFRTRLGFSQIMTALRILSDEQAHALPNLCTKYADFRGLKGKLRLLGVYSIQLT